jgi:hypothetical protein
MALGGIYGVATYSGHTFNSVRNYNCGSCPEIEAASVKQNCLTYPYQLFFVYPNLSAYTRR